MRCTADRARSGAEEGLAVIRRADACVGIGRRTLQRRASPQQRAQHQRAKRQTQGREYASQLAHDITLANAPVNSNLLVKRSH
jgi:hypothetical protein